MKLLIHNKSEYVKCSIAHARKYDRIRPSEVTRLFLKYAFRNKIDSEELAILVSGILSWKNTNGISYHHIGLDTKDNRASNIALVSSNAHGCIHNPSNELKLYRHYNLVIPGYMQGPKAEQLERIMYRKLFSDIKTNCGEFSAFQIVDAISPLIDSGDSFNEDDVVSELSKANIKYITAEDVRQILNNLNFDSESIAGVDYVDNVTGDQVIDILRNLPAEDEYSKHTISCIIDFIKSNQLTRYQIDKYYNQLQSPQ